LSLSANGARFAALAAGRKSGPLVLLLHGFPELSRSWQSQLSALAKAGYRAIAPDMRGYGESEQKGPYDLWTLSQDVRGLIRASGRERAVVVGHDWGGAVAYGAAMFEPDAVERLVVLNAPHPLILRRHLVRNPRQILRSWYMFLFQLPVLPELLFTARGAEAVARGLRGGSTIRDHWTSEELAHYQTAFLKPGAASAAIGYYRAAMRSFFKLRRERERVIEAPTLILWGKEDRFLGTELLEPGPMARFWRQPPEIRFIEGAGHFVQNEAPERINQELLAWLGPAPA
jgi:pimeloyl-ACP methyl ester carboxylesterase